MMEHENMSISFTVLGINIYALDFKYSCNKRFFQINKCIPTNLTVCNCIFWNIRTNHSSLLYVTP